MKYYVNIKFGISNKTYYFATDDASIKIGDLVVLETVVGTEIGEVTTLPRELSTLKFDREIKPIARKANEDDILRYNSNKTLAYEANSIFEEYTHELKLNMNLIGSQYTLDRTKILFTYFADDKIDFRELLKKLAASLHCRIELKQINSRERAQLIGGIGVCGLPLCCTTFLQQFDGITLNKAKNQMLSINIPKLSGQCGRLMCCLKFEDDLYTEEKQKFPPLGTKFSYENEEYKISSFNIFTKVIKIDSKNNTQFITLDEFNKIVGKKVSLYEGKNFSLDKNEPVKEGKNISNMDNSQNKSEGQSNNQKDQKPCKTQTKFEKSEKNRQQTSNEKIQFNNKNNQQNNYNKNQNKNNNYSKNNRNDFKNKQQNNRQNSQKTDNSEGNI